MRKHILANMKRSPVQIPSSAFSRLPFNIYNNTDGSFSISNNFDLQSYLELGSSGDIYVDVATGDNSNDGSSWSLAKKDLWAADAACPTNGTIHVAAGTYNQSANDGGWSGGVGNAGAIIGYGTVVLTACTTGHSWSSDGNHYEAAETGTPRTVWDSTQTDADGSYSELTERASEAEVDTNPGSWYADGSNIFIRTTDDREPDSDIRIAMDNLNCLNATKSIYFENVEFAFSGNRFIRLYQSAGDTRVAGFENCKFSHSGYAYGLIDIDGLSEVYLFGCTLEHSLNEGDGVDYSQLGSIDVFAVEYNCTMHNIQGANNDQCSTGHDAFTVVRINGEYYNAQGQCVAEDDSGGNAWLLGCNMHDSVLGYGYWGGGDADAWLDSCIFYNNSSLDVVSAPGVGVVHLRNCATPNGTGGGGTIVNY